MNARRRHTTLAKRGSEIETEIGIEIEIETEIETEREIGIEKTGEISFYVIC